MGPTVGELPEDLNALLETSYQAVTANPHYDLTLGRRVRILLAPGDYTTGPVIGSTGHRRRTTLGMLATHKVLPIWHQYWPDDYMPDLMLLRSEEVLDRPITVEAARSLIHEGPGHCDDMNFRLPDNDTERMNALGVGGAAVFTFCTAVFDEEMLSGGPYDLDLTDRGMDWDEHDPSFDAAIAYANGAVWCDYSDIERRKEFWHWWLFVAVPAAWAAWPAG